MAGHVGFHLLSQRTIKPVSGQNQLRLLPGPRSPYCEAGRGSGLRKVDRAIEYRGADQKCLTVRQEHVLYRWGASGLLLSSGGSLLIINLRQAAEDHVASGASQIAKQRDLISQLGLTGEDATGAVALLHEMQRTQEQHVDDRDRLRAELAVLNAAEAAKADTSYPGLASLQKA